MLEEKKEPSAELELQQRVRKAEKEIRKLWFLSAIQGFTILYLINRYREIVDNLVALIEQLDKFLKCLNTIG